MWNSQQPTANLSLGNSIDEMGKATKAKRFFRALVSLDVLLTVGALLNLSIYLHSENRGQGGTVASSVLIIFLVVDVVVAAMMWCRIPATLPYAIAGDTRPRLESVSGLAFTNLATNSATTVVWVLTKMAITPSSVVNCRFVLVILLFAILRSAKLVPLLSFWKAAKQYDGGDDSAIVLWDPGLCEERSAWVVDALVILTFAAVLFAVIVLTCFIYSQGGSWTGTLEALENQGAATRPQHPATMARPTGKTPPSDPPAWLEQKQEQKQVNTDNWQPRRLKAGRCDTSCLHSSSDDGECCCAAHCPSGVAIAYKQGANERASSAIAHASAGTVLGGAVGAGSAAAAAAGTAAAGTAAAGTAAAGTAAAAAGTAAAGTAAAVGTGATLGTVAGPVGALAGGALFLIGSLMFAPGYEDEHCVTQCSYISDRHISCNCEDEE